MTLGTGKGWHAHPPAQLRSSRTLPRSTAPLPHSTTVVRPAACSLQPAACMLWSCTGATSFLHPSGAAVPPAPRLQAISRPSKAAISTRSHGLCLSGHATPDRGLTETTTRTRRPYGARRLSPRIAVHEVVSCRSTSVSTGHAVRWPACAQTQRRPFQPPKPNFCGCTCEGSEDVVRASRTKFVDAERPFLTPAGPSVATPQAKTCGCTS